MTLRRLSPLPDAILGVLRGEAAAWDGTPPSADAVFEACAANEVVGLVYERIRRNTGAGGGGPAAWVDRLGPTARADAATELVYRHETAAVLEALASAGVRPVLIKGTALAYSVYPTPSARPRADTDLVVRRDQIDATKRALAANGYAPPVYCGGELLFRQFEMQKTDRFGLTHAVDVHWSISTQTLFAGVLSYDDLDAEAQPLPALGPAARMASPVHALILACIHPVMHHQNEHRLLWTYDIHALASSLGEREWRALVRRATEKQIAVVVASGLDEARRIWRTEIPDDVIRDLRRSTDEPSAEYLEPERRWRHELATNIAHLPSWRSRLRLLREVAFPSRTYMSRSYGVGGATAVLVLPALYIHRLVSGTAKILLGRK